MPVGKLDLSGLGRFPLQLDQTRQLLQSLQQMRPQAMSVKRPAGRAISCQ